MFQGAAHGAKTDVATASDTGSSKENKDNGTPKIPHTNGSSSNATHNVHDANKVNGGTTGNNVSASGESNHCTNNNYVNFNQFMMQHNLVDASRTFPIQPVHNTNGEYLKGISRNAGAGLTSACGTPSMSEAYFKLFPYANQSYYSNEISSANMPHNAAMGREATQQYKSPNNKPKISPAMYGTPYYTPFENINGINYFANPFATGFDICSSTLQPDAPEFVPNFAKLNIKCNDPEAPNQRILVDNPVPGMFGFGKKTNPDENAEEMSTDNFNGNSTAHPLLDETPTGIGQKADAKHDNGSTESERKVSDNVSVANVYNRRVEPDQVERSMSNRQRGSSNSSRRSYGYRDEREDRYERFERPEKKPQKQLLYDNHRSNKRRDDWNRNRDRINGYRVDDLDNSNESPMESPEKQKARKSPKKDDITHFDEKLSQREKLIQDIEMRRLECCVCVEPIKAHQGVWSCTSCYQIMHLKCIIKWASSSKSNEGWRCPACQFVEKEVPRIYYCFCGKQKNPISSRTDLAHSCGEVCLRVDGCKHLCTLLCHPGPCPPCQATVERKCGCGRTEKSMQCSVKEDVICDAICERLLNCEVHKCSLKCHVNKCPACTEKVDQKCYCTKQERQVTCTRDTHEKHTYSCGRPCGKDLLCGNHKCKDCCHAGICRLCKLSPELVITCPCGKLPVNRQQRLTCLDPIPTCDSTCGKTLRCGKPAHPHQCASKCHLGNCPPCNKQTAVKCRCGHMDQMIKCRQLSTRADDARCKKRCIKKRSCGKHKCNQECCIDIDHICTLPCNYTLSCGKHKCDQPCHRGNCAPCLRSSFEELFCECGAEVIYPPVPCGTKRPLCKKPCSRAHPCGHPPQHNCHSGPSCPPCMIFTTKWCYGHHEQRKTVPCSQDSFSCGMACNKPLPRGRHKCIKACHEGPCQSRGEICKQSCTTRRTQCIHNCSAPCHNGDCPELPCKEMVEVQCECGHRKQSRSCHELVREYSRIATAQLASSMAEMQRGNYLQLSEILAPMKLNKTNKTLDCNEDCRIFERNRRLAVGLQTRPAENQPRVSTKYSEFVRGFTKKNPVFVKMVHETLTNLVKLAKESKQKSRSFSFQTMNREKRQVVHELCKVFGIDSISYDKEPNRNVVVTAFKDKTWYPGISVMEVLARENGQRRIPVPSNNAWSSKKE